MMATATVIGVSAGKSLLGSSYYHSELTEKLSCGHDHGLTHHQGVSRRNTITAKKSTNNNTSFFSNRRSRSIKALNEHAGTASDPSTADVWLQKLNHLEEERSHAEFSVEDLLLLKKSVLEKQWNLSTETVLTNKVRENIHKKMLVTGSGTSARRRRQNTRRKIRRQNSSMLQLSTSKQLRSIISPELLKNSSRGHMKSQQSDGLLSHSDVVKLSKITKTGIYLEEQKSRLKERLGCEPSVEQLASSLKISRAELQYKLIECSLARKKLAMSNVRLVRSIAQRYDNMGVQMDDLIQGGLIGLLQGIDKFDSSKGFKISTYLYWWIRQGVSRALVENSTIIRLPAYLHERLRLIRNANAKLKEKGIVPSIDRIAAYLNMSPKKVRNATEAIRKVYSLDREAFPSKDGLPGETLHSYIADNHHLENNPWHGVEEWALKDEVNKLVSTTLGEREREILRLYYGLDQECLTWEEISRRIGLSRERVRQVGLVALEKLKNAAKIKGWKPCMLANH